MHTVKSVGVMSVAKIMGLVHGCLGLMVAPFFLLMGLIPAATNQQQNNPFTGFFGVGMAIVAPFFYAVMGFIFGAIGALLYNLFARLVGGFELQLEAKSMVPVAPYPVIPSTSGI
jgi:hypothetical protein